MKSFGAKSAGRRGRHGHSKNFNGLSEEVLGVMGAEGRFRIYSFIIFAVTAVTCPSDSLPHPPKGDVTIKASE